MTFVRDRKTMTDQLQNWKEIGEIVSQHISCDGDSVLSVFDPLAREYYSGNMASTPSLV